MRIIAGRFGGRRLPASVPTSSRPTSDRVREALFSVLQSRGALVDAHVLDLFAGTGALGLEALSRGAARLLAVDRDPKAIAAIRKNSAALGLDAEVRVLRADVAKLRTADLMTAAGQQAMDVILLDPPYASLAVAVKFLEGQALSPLVHADTLIALEHAASDSVTVPNHLALVSRYRYGDTGIVLLAPIA